MKSATLILLILFAVLLGYSLATFPLGLPRPALLTPLTTLVGFAFALVHAWRRSGWKRALGWAAITFLVSLTFESVGVATGLVYGPYHYTDRLGPLFLGLVPYLIPLAWFMMMYPSLVIAEGLTGGLAGWKRMLTVAAIGGVIMTAWDVVMDPVMVAGGHWVWDVSGAYFGVPLQNYWGWWLTVFTTFMLCQLLPGSAAVETDARFDRQALIAYAFMGVNSIGVALFTGLGGPALAGLFAMGPWVVIGWSRLAPRARDAIFTK